MTSPPGTTDTPRIANILCTSLTSTARHLCKGQRSPKERHLCKAVEDTEAEESGTTEAEGSWGIGCPRWQSNSASLLLVFHVGCRSASGKRRKGSALRRPHRRLAVMPLSVQRKFECIAPVPHTPEVPCVVESRQPLLRRPTLY